MNALEKRCVEISYARKLSHLGSVLGAVRPIYDIYLDRQAREPFVLGNSHAALALWVVLEHFGLCDAYQMSERYGTHAQRDMVHGVWVSGGSLGQPETVALGMALADRDRRVFLMTSDGACGEGVIWEVLRLAADFQLDNLKVSVICNGFGAYQTINLKELIKRLNLFFTCSDVMVDQSRWPVWLRGLAGHYLVLDESRYHELVDE